MTTIYIYCTRIAQSHESIDMYSKRALQVQHTPSNNMLFVNVIRASGRDLETGDVRESGRTFCFVFRGVDLKLSDASGGGGALIHTHTHTFRANVTTNLLHVLTHTRRGKTSPYAPVSVETVAPATACSKGTSLVFCKNIWGLL